MRKKSKIDSLPLLFFGSENGTSLSELQAICRGCEIYESIYYYVLVFIGGTISFEAFTVSDLVSQKKFLKKSTF